MSHHKNPMDESLLNSRRFAGMFSIQFLNVLSDNLLKNAILVMIAFSSITIGKFNSTFSINIITILFTLPFFIFASYAGKIADSSDKVQIIKIIKLCEILIVTIASAGIVFENIWLMMVAVLLMSSHSTFFSPIKYSILPQYFSQPKKLLLANSYVEVGSFIAVLIGQIIGSWFIGNHQPTIVIYILWLSGVCGLIMCMRLEPLPIVGNKSNFNWNFFKDNIQLYRQITCDKQIKRVVHSIAWFWALGIIYTTQLAIFTKTYIGGSAQIFSILLAEFSIAIGIGSLVCTNLSKGTIHKKFITIGLFSISFFTILLLILNFHEQHSISTLLQFSSSIRGIINYILIFCIGFMAGFYSITCYNELQLISPLNIFSRIVSVSNLLNASYMLATTICCTILLTITNLWWLFAIIAIANAGLAIYQWKDMKISHL